jgi:hypothetical protein
LFGLGEQDGVLADDVDVRQRTLEARGVLVVWGWYIEHKVLSSTVKSKLEQGFRFYRISLVLWNFTPKLALLTWLYLSCDKFFTTTFRQVLLAKVILKTKFVYRRSISMLLI